MENQFAFLKETSSEGSTSDTEVSLGVNITTKMMEEEVLIKETEKEQEQKIEEGAEDCECKTTTEDEEEDEKQVVLEKALGIDCTFLLGPNKEKLCCHKQILGSASVVFHTMFFGMMAEHGKNISKIEIIEIPDVQAEEFKMMIEYIYTRSVKIKTTQSAFNLYYIAHKYMIKELKEECLDILCRAVTPENACDLFNAAMAYSESELVEHCRKYIQCFAVEILHEPNFQLISHTCLLEILKDNKLNVPSELNVINACIRWAKSEVKRKQLPDTTEGWRTALGSAFSMMRFLTLKPGEFADGPVKSDLLTQDECLSILLNLVSSASNFEMKSALCSKRQPRHYTHADPLDVFLPLPISAIKTCKLGNDEFPNNSQSQYFFSTTTSILRFTVSRDILLLGFQVPTQFAGKLDVSSVYYENIGVTMFSDDHKIDEIDFTGRVEYDCLMNLCFRRPVRLSKDFEQEVVITSRHEGCYNILRPFSRLIKNQVDDCIFCTNGTYNDGMVYSIFFTNILEIC